MGDLIVMSRFKSSPARVVDAGSSAEILFFTGVRYYRMEEPAEPAAQAATVQQATLAKRALAKRRRSLDQRRIPKLKREQRLEALA